MKLPKISGGNTRLKLFLFFSIEKRKRKVRRQWSCISCFTFMSSIWLSLYCWLASYVEACCCPFKFADSLPPASASPPWLPGSPPAAFLAARSLLNGGQLSIIILPIRCAPCNHMFKLIWSFSDMLVRIDSIWHVSILFDTWRCRRSSMTWAMFNSFISMSKS